MEERKPIGIWIRVSTEDQARGESPANHRARAEQYAALKGWEVVEIYDLSGVSGKAVLEHPEARRMLDDVRSGRIRALVLSKLARLGRNVRELLAISDTFRECGADLVFIEESIDTGSPAGRMLFTVLGALAEWEREEISARVAASVPIRASRGRPIGGIGPYGFRWVDGRLEHHPDEVPVVRRLFEVFLGPGHGRLRTTADRLNAEGYRARRGPWSDSSVRRVLTDPAAVGMRRANYSKSNGDGRSWRRKPESEWVVVPVEPIIEKETWDRAQALLREYETRYPRRPKQPRYLFSGLLSCGCGAREKMYVMPYDGMRDPRYICRACRNKVWESEVLDRFLAVLQGLAVNPQALAEGGDDEGRARELEARIELLAKDLAKVRREIDTLLELYGTGVLTKGDFGERYEPLRERKERMAAEQERLREEVEREREMEAARRSLAQEAPTLVEDWEAMNVRERVELARAMISGVTAHPDRILISLRYFPELTALCNSSRTSRDSWPPRA